jgi:hypothetical protein
VIEDKGCWFAIPSQRIPLLANIGYRSFHRRDGSVSA